ncbi:hypothetical protein TSMEX_002386 [Taenia solium]|eukprot:TsM_000814600 transcript=TsM_000814600 gene=TsM_000814600
MIITVKNDFLKELCLLRAPVKISGSLIVNLFEKNLARPMDTMKGFQCRKSNLRSV